MRTSKTLIIILISMTVLPITLISFVLLGKELPGQLGCPRREGNGENTIQNIFGFPYFEVQFNKKGAVHDEKEVTALTEFLAEGGTTDLFIISHGWNNNTIEARELYCEFFRYMREVLKDKLVPGVNARKFAIVGVLWPSKKFADKELKPGGAAFAELSVTDNDIMEQLNTLKEIFEDPNADSILEKLKQSVSKLDDGQDECEKFIDLVRSLLPQQGTAGDEDASKEFLKLPADEIIRRLDMSLPTPMIRSDGSAQNSDMKKFGKISFSKKSIISDILNYLTYYQMRERASIVGFNGVNQLLQKIQTQCSDIKIHLIGHSFGGRLVTAAATGSDKQPAVKSTTMILLQAAFSHYGFAEHYDGANNGFFRSMITKSTVSGPILITCTKNDRVLGIPYALASRLAGHIDKVVGDENNPYGAIGRNGAQKTPEAATDEKELREPGYKYKFQKSKIYNLNGDKFIGDHSDICKKEVAYAVLSAISKN